MSTDDLIYYDEEEIYEEEIVEWCQISLFTSLKLASDERHASEMLIALMLDNKWEENWVFVKIEWIWVSILAVPSKFG
jgi:hypothetical protein